jgi:hypothetical protein
MFSLGCQPNKSSLPVACHGRWFSPGTPASSTTKTGRHYIAEILLKVALNAINQIKSQLHAVLITNCMFYIAV